MTLAAAQGHAPLADASVVGLRQRGDIVMDLGGARGALDARLLGPGVGVSDIVGHRGIEQEGFLLHQADMPAQGGEGDIADVLAVEGHPPAGDVVEARDEIGDRRLARARWPDDPQGPARPDLEADVGEHRLAGDEGEIHALEAQHPRQTTTRSGRARRGIRAAISGARSRISNSRPPEDVARAAAAKIMAIWRIGDCRRVM